MSDVFKARFDGREWWATPYPEAVDTRVELRPGAADKATQHIMEPSLIVPERLVERVEDIPPEPTEPGTVMYDRNDVAWFRGIGIAAWRAYRGHRASSDWTPLVQMRGPLHPYPRAAREEIKRLTAERDEAAGEADSEGRHVRELQERIDNAKRLARRSSWVESRHLRHALGEVDQ